MGGNVFKADHNVIRLNKKDYEEYCSEISNIIFSITKNNQLFIVPAIAEKDTFGDMDIVIPVSLQDKIVPSLRDKFIYKNNGNVFSFLYKSFQIDLIFVDDSIYNYACHYFSWNDIGNIVGRLLKQYGFKHGWQGLYYVQRNGDHVVKEHLLSTNYLDAINILGLNKRDIMVGFDTYQNMFDWIVSSPKFIYPIFKFENLNHTNKVRDAKRKTYNMFLKYLSDINETNPFKEPEPLTHEEKLQCVLSYFPHIKKDIEEAEKQIQIHNVIRSKFNGKLVMQLTGLTNIELGNFMKYFKQYYTDKWIYDTSQNEINLLIVKLYKGLVCQN